MWHEARRQERKIRGMLVDYRRRAERRRDFYEKIKADPTQFLQLHGRPCKIHLDSAIAQAADSPATMMPWQGQADNLIDRFDVRAHLDFIPVLSNKDEDEPSYEERQCHYESYRILAQNNFLGIHEEKFLKQLHLEEQYGYTAEADKEKKRKNTGATIGFNYDDPTAAKDLIKNNNSSDEEEESDSDLDVDLCIDVSKIEQSQAHEMNKCGQQFGMSTNDFYSFLTNDLEEAENIRLAREEEHEKALFSGRKSRRERRAHREKRLANRVLSPPSYAARDSPTYPAFRESKSRSKSPSPVNTGQITYITSFGEDEEPTPSTSKPTYADKVKFGKRKSEPEKIVVQKAKPRKSTDSCDRDRRYRRRSRSRSRTRYYRHRRSRSRSHRRSRSRNKSRSRSRSRNKRHRSRSRSRKTSRRNSREKRTSSSSPTHSSSISVSRSSKSSLQDSSSSPELAVKKEEPPKPIQRYYGRRVSDKSSSELEDSPDEEVKSPGSNPATADKVSFGNSGNAVKPSSSIAKITPQERLKRKMQLLLNKQYKADKIAEQIRSERAQQEQRNREDELREMALKLRRKQRERRHAYDDNSSKSSDSESSSSSGPVSETRSKRSPTPPSPKRRSSKDEERPRVRERSPQYRSRTEYRSSYRGGSTSPTDKRHHDDSKRNKYRSLVDY